MSNFEFSNKQIKNVVLKESVQAPITVYPTAIGILGVAGMLLWGVNLFTIAATAVGLGLAAINFGNEYFRRGHAHSIAYLNRLHDQMKYERNKKLISLKKDLSDMGAEDAVEQLALFSKKFDNFTSILKHKFAEHELTYSRYLGIAEQVFLAGLDNLEELFLALKSISAVDIGYLEEKLNSASSDNEKRALHERLNMFNQQHKHVKALLEENEQALTEIDNVSTKLATVQTQRGNASVDMELAMQELNRMAKRASQYSNSN